jgi:hypothetical protein
MDDVPSKNKTEKIQHSILALDFAGNIMCIYIYMILVAMILEYMLVIGAPSLEDAGGIAIPSYIPEMGV